MEMVPVRRNWIGSGMSDFAYFEYALVLPEERYLIEVHVRKPDSTELRGQEEIEGIAKAKPFVQPTQDTVQTNDHATRNRRLPSRGL
jgi:hypothetical protein